MRYRRALCCYSWPARSSSYAQAITCHDELEKYPKLSRHFDKYRSARKRPNSLSLCDIAQRVLRRPVGCYPHRFQLCSESPLAVFRFALSDAPSTSPLRCEIAMGMPAATSAACYLPRTSLHRRSADGGTALSRWCVCASPRQTRSSKNGTPRVPARGLGPGLATGSASGRAPGPPGPCRS